MLRTLQLHLCKKLHETLSMSKAQSVPSYTDKILSLFTRKECHSSLRTATPKLYLFTRGGDPAHKPVGHPPSYRHLLTRSLPAKAA